MKKQIPSFLRHKARIARRSAKVSLLLGLSLGLVGQVAAFDDHVECENFACEDLVNVRVAGDLNAYISLMISGRPTPAAAHTGNSIAIGNNAQAGELPNMGSHQIALGANSAADGLSAVSLGAMSSANGDGSVSVGRHAASTGNGASAVGNRSKASAELALAIGNEAEAGKSRAVAIGVASMSTAEGGVAIGGRANVKEGATNALALGRGALVMGANSVALGSGSSASQENSVSVGNSVLRRRITNVEAGVNDNDVVTVGQLKALGLWPK